MKRVLVISPHPDDESIGCGGTLRKHVVEGDIVHVIFLTSGESGGHGRGVQETRRLREAEAKKAAKILGLAKIEFWQEPDGALRAARSVVRKLQSVIKAWKPDLLYAPHGEEQHPDHRSAARLVRRALAGLPARDSKPLVRLFEVWTPLQRMDHIEDISDYIKVKLAAIEVYATQCAVVDFVDAFRGLARYRGEMHCWPEGEYAEVFAELPRKS